MYIYRQNFFIFFPYSLIKYKNSSKEHKNPKIKNICFAQRETNKNNKNKKLKIIKQNAFLSELIQKIKNNNIQQISRVISKKQRKKFVFKFLGSL